VSRVAEVIQAMARHEAERRTFCELAVVTSTFDGADGDDTHSVSVRLKDSGVPLTRLPLATTLTGAAALPRTGDVVLVLFPRGDLGSGVVIGQVYSDERRPPDFDRDEAVLVWPGDAADPESEAVDLRLRGGEEREAALTLGGSKDARARLRDGVIELIAGGVEVRLAHSSSSDGKVTLAAGGTSITLEQDGDVTVEAVGTLTLKATKVVIEGDTQVVLNGQVVEIN
jgi:phage baseplate assembly protein gpV